MKNKDFIQACINHYKFSIKNLDVPGIHLSRTGRLMKNGSNGDRYAIIEKKGLVNGNLDDNYRFCGSEFNALWKVNKSEIKRIFKENNYYFTTAYEMYGDAYYEQFKA